MATVRSLVVAVLPSALLLAACAGTVESPRIDPFESLQPVQIQKTDLALAMASSQSTTAAIEQLNATRDSLASFGALANRTAMADLDPRPLVDGLIRILNYKFSRIVRVNHPSEAKNAGADLTAVVDVSVKLGRRSGQMTQVQLKVLFATLDGGPIATVEGAGEAPVPFPASTYGFQPAADKTLAAFTKSFSTPATLSALGGIRQQPPITTAPPQPSTAPRREGGLPGEGGWKSAGSGFILSGTAHVLTSYHVVRGAEKLRVSLPSGEVYPGSVVARDANNDLALVLLQGMRPKEGGFMPSLEVEVKPGEAVHALGYPLGASMSRQPSIVSGQVSAATGLQDNVAQFRTTAPINEGNSGGPFVNAYGALVGVASSGLVQQGVEAIRFATKIATAGVLLTEARLTRLFTISVEPRRDRLPPEEIFRFYAPYVVLIETQ